MKIKVTNRELKECITNVMERIISEGKSKRDSFKKGNRDSERGYYGNDGGKVHKHRKDERKWNYNKYNEEELNEDRLNLNSPDDMDIEGEDVLAKKRHYVDTYADDTTPAVEVKTDIDEVETELINNIRSKFEFVDTDTVDGYFTFIVPVKMEKEFIDFLRSEDVNIIE